MPTDLPAPPVSLAQQERLTLWAQGRPSQDQPTFAWSFPREIAARDAESAWHQVVSRYETLRSVFGTAGDGTFTCRREEADGTAARTFVETAPEDFFTALCAPVELVEGPLARLVVSPTSTETLIGLSIDHLVTDGHSYRRVLAAFFALLRGEAPAGPAPTTVDAFVRAELQAAASATGEKALAYWRRTTGGVAYPPLHPSLSRPAGRPVTPETAHAETVFDPSAPYARYPMTRSGMVLASVAAAIARTLGLPENAEPFTVLLQSSRRAGDDTQAMAGFLSNWQVTRFPVVHSAEGLLDEVTNATFRAMRAHHVHHAEIVRRLQPEFYGARYVPSEPLPPYALFNYLAEDEAPRVGDCTGTPLAVPPMGAYRLHGALRIYGTEHADASGAAVRLVADASVFGSGFAQKVADAMADAMAVGTAAPR